MVNELEYKSYEKQLRKLRLFSLGKKKLRKDLTAPGSKEVGGRQPAKGQEDMVSSYAKGASSQISGRISSLKR